MTVITVGSDRVAGAFMDRAEAHDFVKECKGEPITVSLGDEERANLDQRTAHQAIEELWKGEKS
jgi:hypothetical protein